jgi:hypothetical protein
MFKLFLFHYLSNLDYMIFIRNNKSSNSAVIVHSNSVNKSINSDSAKLYPN